MAGYDAKAHLTKINVGSKERPTWADYMLVRDRVAWLRAECPAAVVETELDGIHGELVVMKARVSLPTGGVGTGWGSCRLAIADAVEKAETTALGRALAHLGFGTQFARDCELELVDSPVAPPPPPVAPPPPPRCSPPGPAGDFMPVDPATAVMWFKGRVAASHGVPWAEGQGEEVARAVARTLRDAGLSDECRLAAYVCLTGKAEGLAMDPRALRLLAELAATQGAVSVLAAIGGAAMAAGGEAAKAAAARAAAMKGPAREARNGKV